MSDASPLNEIMSAIKATKPIVLDDDYHAARNKAAEKLHGMIPVLEGELCAIDIAQDSGDAAYLRLVIRSDTFDQLALMSGPNYKMKLVIFEKRAV